MIQIRILALLSLSMVLLAACAPAPDAAPTQLTAPTSPLPQVSVSTEISASPTDAAVSHPTAVPMATSRGPDLHATDPSTVSLASGGLHFVEFFRFT